jgi:hypothetical protein
MFCVTRMNKIATVGVAFAVLVGMAGCAPEPDAAPVVEEPNRNPSPSLSPVRGPSAPATTASAWR